MKKLFIAIIFLMTSFSIVTATGCASKKCVHDHKDCKHKHHKNCLYDKEKKEHKCDHDCAKCAKHKDCPKKKKKHCGKHKH